MENTNKCSYEMKGNELGLVVFGPIQIKLQRFSESQQCWLDRGYGNLTIHKFGHVIVRSESTQKVILNTQISGKEQYGRQFVIKHYMAKVDGNEESRFCMKWEAFDYSIRERLKRWFRIVIFNSIDFTSFLDQYLKIHAIKTTLLRTKTEEYRTDETDTETEYEENVNPTQDWPGGGHVLFPLSTYKSNK